MGGGTYAYIQHYAWTASDNFITSMQIILIQKVNPADCCLAGNIEASRPGHREKQPGEYAWRILFFWLPKNRAVKAPFMLILYGNYWPCRSSRSSRGEA